MKLTRKKPKTAPNQPKRSRQQKLMRAAKLLGVLAGIILLFSLMHLVRGRQVTKQRFEESGTPAKVAKYYQAQAAALGLEYNPKDLKKTCFKYQPIGGGPAVIGPELWCAVGVTKDITVPPNTESIVSVLDKLNAVARTEGMSVNTVLAGSPGSFTRTADFNSFQYIEYAAGNGNAYDPGGFGCSIYAKSNYLPITGTNDYVLAFPNEIGYQSATDQPPNKPATLHYNLECQGSAAYIPPGYVYTGKQQ